MDSVCSGTGSRTPSETCRSSCGRSRKRAAYASRESDADPDVFPASRHAKPCAQATLDAVSSEARPNRGGTMRSPTCSQRRPCPPPGVSLSQSPLSGSHCHLALRESRLAVSRCDSRVGPLPGACVPLRRAPAACTRNGRRNGNKPGNESCNPRPGVRGSTHTTFSVGLAAGLRFPAIDRRSAFCALASRLSLRLPEPRHQDLLSCAVRRRSS